MPAEAQTQSWMNFGGRRQGTRRSPWPLSVKILIGVGLLFLLQAFPYTGVFLMLVAAPFWSVILVNLAVIVAGFEALLGRAPRWFLLVPICWFGFYAIAFGLDRMAFQSLGDEISTANEASAPIEFSPEHHDIIANDFVDELLLRHLLPVVYVQHRRGREQAMKAARLATGSLCQSLKGKNEGTGVDVRKIHPSTLKRFNLELYDPLCVVSYAETPSKKIIEIYRHRTRTPINGLPARSNRISAKLGERRAEIRSVRTSLLRPFPMPIIGCALNSGAPSWDCFAQFMRGSHTRLGIDTERPAALRQVLDLSQVQQRLPGKQSNADLLSHLSAADLEYDNQRQAKLEAFLRDPGALKGSYKFFRLFETEPEKIKPYAGQLITALESADARVRKRDRGAVKTAISLSKLVAQLPEDAIRQNSDRLLALLNRDARRWHRSARPLILRTAELEDKAVPVLVNLLHRPTRVRSISPSSVNAIIALCRMGERVRTQAGPKLLEIWHWRNTERNVTRRSHRDGERKIVQDPSLTRQDRYLYLALLRLGLHDLAGPAKLKSRTKWWQWAEENVSQNSPVEVCEQVK